VSPRIVVFGNEKGGSGKSTAAIQVAVGLLRQGFNVATLDLDARQGTFSRYLDHRAARGGLPLPHHVRLAASALEGEAGADADWAALTSTFEGFGSAAYVVVDTPGSDTRLNRLAHAAADTLVTPINDSFVDFDLLARVDPATRRIIGPSIYSELVWERRKERAMAGGKPIDWIVMRNRMGHAEARNKREMGESLTELAKRIGFRIAPGFGERVIFRELFLSGLTLFDLGAAAGGPPLAMSHVAARQEARGLIDAILSPPTHGTTRPAAPGPSPAAAP
jgi:chromosome partitioning protein